jgi:hypothetical protein
MLIGTTVKMRAWLRPTNAMVRIPEWHGGIVALLIALAFSVSCSRENPYEARVKNMPRRFQVSGRGFLLNEQEPGVIDDDAIVYTEDAGARTFNFKTRTVLRHLFVGRWDEFDSLPPDERREVKALASGALDFIGTLEKRQNRLSEVDQRHRVLLRTFLANSGQSQ